MVGLSNSAWSYDISQGVRPSVAQFYLQSVSGQIIVAMVSAVPGKNIDDKIYQSYSKKLDKTFTCYTYQNPLLEDVEYTRTNGLTYINKKPAFSY